jgi:Fe2+ transport system protein FeoA
MRWGSEDEMAAQPVPVTSEALASCPLCGFEYAPGGESCRERGCPVAFGGCATRHCPRCGYTMPDEARSTAAKLVRLLFRTKALLPARTLADLPSGASAVIEKLEGDPGLLARLTAQGLAPGVAIHVVQRTPTHVIELGETMIAVETRVAKTIFVRLPAG